MFNVNHFIVSQVNPHVVPFLAKEEDAINTEAQQNAAVSAGPGWMHSMASFAKGEALHRLEVLAEMGVFPNTMSKVRSVLNQRYSGDITIFPAISYTNFPKILSNPTTDYMLRCLLAGEQATWTKVSRIQNHLAIELALDEAVNQILPCVHFSQSQANLRLLSFHRPVSQGAEVPPAHPTRRHKRDAHSESQGTLLAPFTPFAELSSPDFARRVTPHGSGADCTASKPYLPSRPSMRSAQSPDLSRVAFSTIEAVSSTDADESPTDADVSDNIESDTSEILSSPSPLHSPSLRIPDSGPASGQTAYPFLSVSNPHTPAAPVALFNNRHGYASLMPAAPSSPELRYKRLFHPPAGTTGQPNCQREVKRVLQPLSTIPGPKHAESNVEHRQPELAGLAEIPHQGEEENGATKGVVPGEGERGLSRSPRTSRDVLKDESYFQPRPWRGNGTPRW